MADPTTRDLEIRAANFPGIRLITVPNRGTQEPQKDFHGKWEVCSPQTVGGFSAVGFFFGRQLHQTLGVPIGLINDSWGGSACEAWIPREKLAADPEYKPLLERWEQIEKDYPQDKKAHEEWQAAASKAKAEGKTPPRSRTTRMGTCTATPGPATSITACCCRPSVTASRARSGTRASRMPAAPTSTAISSP